MFTCSKTYRDIPFAHRQPAHEGHCQLIHGHNWSFTFTFGCKSLDEKGFVVDFGKLKFIRHWLEGELDHAYVYNQDDEATARLVATFPDQFKPYPVASCSAEGLAKHAYEKVSGMLEEHHGDRVWLLAVEVAEDSRNSARFHP
ncbi:MAG: 6-carboxytetrahydropterin synthase [Verrucomicrobiae bacterium]|nr:6-carboxytetrahydropterin synthase [Verrucomicrobiae bacterium]